VLGVTKGYTTSSPAGFSTPHLGVGVHRRRDRRGLRRDAPGAELMFVDFMGVCFDQNLQPGREIPVHVRRQGITPVVIRTMRGRARAAASTPVSCIRCSRTSPAEVVLPHSVHAKGMMIQAIRGNDP